MQFTPGAKAPGALSFWGEKSAFEKNSVSYQKSRIFAGGSYCIKDITERKLI